MERAEQIALHLAKLIHASGGNKELAKVLLPEGLDVIDSELDVEALTRALLAVARDLDVYLQSLITPEKHPINKLRDECKRLEQELTEKDELIAKNLDMLQKSKNLWNNEVEQQKKKLYPD